MRIDVHAHYFPTEYLDLLDRFGGSQVGTAIARNFLAGKEPKELEARFRMMDDAGVDMQMLSVGPQLPYFEEEAHAAEAARVCNNMYAELVKQYPPRFKAFACTPLPHMKASIAELSRCLDELGMVGATVATTVLGRTIADASFEPLFAELNRRKAVLFIHPAGISANSPYISQYDLKWPIGAPFEDTICVLHLLKAGITTRYPNVKIIFSHLGGTLPFLTKRLDAQAPWFMPESSDKPSVLARGLWYDSVNAHGPALRCACETYGADRILLGTDYPYWRDEFFRLAVTYVQQSGLSSNDISRILDENARNLLGLASNKSR